MRKLLIGLILALSITSALPMSSKNVLAQNPTCPTRPFGDNSNACASTAFVQAATGVCSALGAFPVGTGSGIQCSTVSGAVANLSGTFTGSPPNGTTQGLLYTQTGLSGSPVGNNYFANTFAISADTADASGNANNTYVTLYLPHTFGGATVKGSRSPLWTVLTLNGATNAANTNRNYVGISALSQAQTGDGGTNTGAGALGEMFGIGAAAVARTGAQNFTSITGGEINVALEGTATSKAKIGWRITQLNTDAVSGATYDSAFQMTNQVGAIGWINGITFDASYAQAPLKATGTAIKAIGAQTWDTGIDFTAAAMTKLMVGTGYVAAFASTGGTFSSIQPGDLGTARSATTGTVFFGSSGTRYIFHDGTNFFFSGAALPVASGGSGAATLTGILLGNGTSAFTGITTSAGIAGAISDETGSGALMFATSPSVTTDIRSASDGGADLGTSALRWGTVFVNTATGSGQADRTWSMARQVTAATAGKNWTFQASGAVSGGTDLKGGDLILSAGTAVGTGGTTGAGAAVILFGPGSGLGAGTTDRAPAELLRVTGLQGGYAAICFRTTACSATNYAFLGQSGDTASYFNADAALKFRIVNADVASITVSGFTMATSGYVGTGMSTVANLPTCNAASKTARHFATDATSSLTAGIGAAPVGGGANNVPVVCDGAGWRIGQSNEMRRKVYAILASAYRTVAGLWRSLGHSTTAAFARSGSAWAEVNG